MARIVGTSAVWKSSGIRKSAWRTQSPTLRSSRFMCCPRHHFQETGPPEVRNVAPHLKLVVTDWEHDEDSLIPAGVLALHDAPWAFVLVGDPKGHVVADLGFGLRVQSAAASAMSSSSPSFRHL